MKTVVITGPSSGIGRVTALRMGELGYHVVAAGRSYDRTKPVVDAIRTKGGSSEFLQLDLVSLDAVRNSATEFEQRGLTVDVLVNNAGISMTKGVTDDGFEINFGVNHLGHFQFTHHLRRTFRPGARIINLTSAFHARADGIEFDRLQQRSKSILGLKEYAVSKLANILFSAELARRQPDWRTFAVHPGFVDTGIIPGWLRPFVRKRLISPELGASTTIWCATEPTLADESGHYYVRSAPATPSGPALGEGLARELWERSERWCGAGPVN